MKLCSHELKTGLCHILIQLVHNFVNKTICRFDSDTNQCYVAMTVFYEEWEKILECTDNDLQLTHLLILLKSVMVKMNSGCISGSR